MDIVRKAFGCLRKKEKSGVKEYGEDREENSFARIAAEAKEYIQNWKERGFVFYGYDMKTEEYSFKEGDYNRHIEEVRRLSGEKMKNFQKVLAELKNFFPENSSGKLVAEKIEIDFDELKEQSTKNTLLYDSNYQAMDVSQIEEVLVGYAVDLEERKAKMIDKNIDSWQVLSNSKNNNDFFNQLKNDINIVKACADSLGRQQVYNFEKIYFRMMDLYQESCDMEEKNNITSLMNSLRLKVMTPQDFARDIDKRCREMAVKNKRPAK